MHLAKRWTIALIVGLSMLAGPARAETEDEIKARIKALQPADYPTEPIEFVVVYPAGGGMDVTARILAKYVEKWSGQKIVVTNKVGGAGMVGHTYLGAQAPNDGYTVGVVSTYWTDAFLRAKGKFDYTSLDPLAFINYDPVTWIVRTDGPFKDASLKDLVSYAKQKPGELKVGLVPGISSEFIAEQFEGIAKSKITKVPFQGGAPSITALLGGHIDVSFGFYGEYRGHLEAGKVRAIGVAATDRVSNLPDTPTFNEALGTDEIVWAAWRYAGVPKGTPPDRKAWLEAALNAALDDPAIGPEYTKTGAIMDRRRLTSAKAVSDEVDRLAKRERAFFIRTGRMKE